MQPPFITNIFCDLYRIKQLDLVLYSHYTMCRTREQEISQEIVIYRKKEHLMKKNINKEVLAGLTKLSEENGLFGYLAGKRMYRADCVCHLVKLPFDFKKW